MQVSVEVNNQQTTCMQKVDDCAFVIIWIYSGGSQYLSAKKKDSIQLKIHLRINFF